jgi:hypothetical protein
VGTEEIAMRNENTAYDEKAKELYAHHAYYTWGSMEGKIKDGWKPWANMKRKERDYWRALVSCSTSS